MPGPVTGAPGAYSNRTDLQAGTQPVRAAPGQQYGQGAQQERAQQMVPLPDFTAPTTRPHEPLTHGMDVGPGASAAQAGIPVAPPPQADVLDRLRAIYQTFPTDDLADLLATLEGQ